MGFIIMSKLKIYVFTANFESIFNKEKSLTINLEEIYIRTCNRENHL